MVIMNENLKIPKILAYYLPAFHEIKENNEWYGEGFTEWDNTRKGKMYYRKHYQPRIPYMKNYYDLSDDAQVIKQMEYAEKYGIYGFVYYHYWFNGRKILEKPAECMLNNVDAKLHFCFCWANEAWRKTWNDKAGDAELLIDQTYGGEQDWKNHYNYLRKFFMDERYIKVDNKPMLLIYKINQIPDFNQMVNFLNSLAVRDGFSGIHFVRMRIGKNVDFRGLNCAYSVDFEPGTTAFDLHPNSIKDIRLWKIKRSLYFKLSKFNFMTKILNDTIDYKSYFNSLLEKSIDKKQYYSLICDWDNTPRKGRRGWSFSNVSIAVFKDALKKLLQKSKEEGKEFIFIFAWNEWGEGGYLEPDEKRKFGFLEAVRSSYNECEMPLPTKLYRKKGLK